MQIGELTDECENLRTLVQEYETATERWPARFEAYTTEIDTFTAFIEHWAAKTNIGKHILIPHPTVTGVENELCKECCLPWPCPTVVWAETSVTVDTPTKSLGEYRVQPDRPEIVCLCGSTRFIKEWNYWRQRLTCEGKIVLAIEIVTSQDIMTDPQHADPEMKAMLDELHKRKIDLADRVFILNVGGYIGPSTQSEIEYAQSHGKAINYLEPRG
jgi:hypothetical protein